jgi:hypothetical protein
MINLTCPYCDCEAEHTEGLHGRWRYGIWLCPHDDDRTMEGFIVLAFECMECDREFYVNEAVYLDYEPSDKYPIEDWKYEVQNGDTKLGYKEWLEHMIEAEDD